MIVDIAIFAVGVIIGSGAVRLIYAWADKFWNDRENP